MPGTRPSCYYTTNSIVCYFSLRGQSMSCVRQLHSWGLSICELLLDSWALKPPAISCGFLPSAPRNRHFSARKCIFGQEKSFFCRIVHFYVWEYIFLKEYPFFCSLLWGFDNHELVHADFPENSARKGAYFCKFLKPLMPNRSRNRNGFIQVAATRNRTAPAKSQPKSLRTL